MRMISMMIIQTHWIHAKTIPTRIAVGFGALAPTIKDIEVTRPIRPAKFPKTQERQLNTRPRMPKTKVA
jgi:hypothetical protein